MWSLRNWRRQRTLAKHSVAPDLWRDLCRQLPILDGLSQAQLDRLRDASVLFLHDKHLTTLPGVELDDGQRLFLAAQAQLPLLGLADLDWYQGFHEIVLYPDDFRSPQRYRDPSGVEHEWDGEHSGEAWLRGPVILAWPGVLASGGWDGYNLVIHELAHKLDMLNGDANGLPPLHSDMKISDWASVMQQAFDNLNHQLDAHPDAEPAIDPYAAEDPAEFFAVTSEYFFSAPDLLHAAYPRVYEQLQAFYRQDTLSRLQALQRQDPAYAEQHSSHHQGQH
ncbi:M90 family metallopeptidase [Pseudomonas sp. JDS28PS106]|uniref:M90 family metallopeptidase n=1 Tax=Pseudomonas sp. JDS28PS106 TaxID=2497235 RepID=UPI002FD6E620